MNLFLQLCGCGIITAVLSVMLRSFQSDVAILLIIGACIFLAVSALEFLRPVLEFLTELEEIGSLDHAMVSTLLKAAGIGIITEIVCAICKDSGAESLGRIIQLLGTAVILRLSVPLYSALLDLIQKILGEL